VPAEAKLKGFLLEGMEPIDERVFLNVIPYCLVAVPLKMQLLWDGLGELLHKKWWVFKFGGKNVRQFSFDVL
jgi:hypothetical protein